MAVARIRPPALFAVLSVALALLTVAMISGRRSTEQGRVDQMLSTTADAKAALVGTELERARALALVTARIPPFSELYADGGSLAARIAAVAGPFREINNALAYDHALYPARFVEVGYVDVSGQERARVVNGRRTPIDALLPDVRGWPSYQPGVHTPVGETRFTLPFLSPTARVPVIAATTTVSVNGSVRAYVEIELALRALRGVLAADAPSGGTVELVKASGRSMLAVGRPVTAPGRALGGALRTVGSERLVAVRVPVRAVAGGPWYVVAATRARSALALGLGPSQGALGILSLLALVVAAIGFRRAHAASSRELAREQEAREEAERRSRIDALTGLYNRRHVVETLEHELARAARQDGAVGVLMLDIDHFKRVNDVYGHAVGDAVLVEVARRLSVELRSWDVVARVGGEEFCVVTPGLGDEAAVLALAERMRGAVAERAVLARGDVAIPVTVSVGAALLHSGEGSAELAFDRADRALYAAKRRGRNRSCAFSELDAGDARAEQPACLQLAEALAAASHLREGMPPDHSRAVAELAAAVARRLGLDEGEVLRAQLGGWLHDVGKLGVSDEILVKAGPLTEAEWATVRTHPAAGEALVRSFPELALAARAVRNHHERWDGNGYPDRLAGETIPLEARIVGAAEAYHAILSDRPHRVARAPEDAVAELRRCAGSQFDAAVVEALVAVVEFVAAPGVPGAPGGPGLSTPSPTPSPTRSAR